MINPVTGKELRSSGFRIQLLSNFTMSKTDLF